MSTENFPLRATKMIREWDSLSYEEFVRQLGFFSPRRKGSVGIISK